MPGMRTSAAPLCPVSLTPVRLAHRMTIEADAFMITLRLPPTGHPVRPRHRRPLIFREYFAAITACAGAYPSRREHRTDRNFPARSLPPRPGGRRRSVVMTAVPQAG
ncbi:hypothetical protein GCM10010282_41700 [Streptomyces roseolus]|nr:hypothetical protein GCM10010282_41700 [Streptomyces roseolus]